MAANSSWSQQEDERLRRLIDQHGAKRWSLISSLLGSKGSKQCRRRWKNCLNADLKKGGWSKEEDEILLEGHRVHGNRWTEIARMVGGRTDNAVKNRWAAICKRKTSRVGKSSGGALPRDARPASARTRSGAAQATRGGASAARRQGEHDETSEDEEEEEEEEEDMSASEDEDSGRRQRQQRGKAEQQRRRQQQQQLQQQGKAKQAPAPVSYPAVEHSQSSAPVPPRQSPTVVSAVGMARSVLASTGTLMQPMQRLGSTPALPASTSRLNLVFQNSHGGYEQLQQQEQQYNSTQVGHNGYQYAKGDLYGGFRVSVRPPTGATYKQQQQHPQQLAQHHSQQHPHYRQQQQQRQQPYPQQQDQAVLELGSNGSSRLQLGQKRQHPSLDLGLRGVPAYSAVITCPAIDGMNSSGSGRQDVTTGTTSWYAPPNKRQSLGLQSQLHDASAVSMSAATAGGLRRSPPSHQPAFGGWQHSSSSGVSSRDGGSGDGVRPPHTSPTTPLMLALSQDAGQGTVSDPSSSMTLAGSSTRCDAGGYSDAYAPAADISAVHTVKRPPGLSISIPYGPDADPVPPVNYQIKVFADRLTPAEREHANEINQMELPVQIHVSDEPPLTSSRHHVQQSQLALSSPTAPQGVTTGSGEAPDAMDSPADWMSRFDRFLDPEGLHGTQGLSPGALGLTLAQGSGSSPRRPTTRGMLRGSPQGTAYASPFGMKQEATAAAVAARARMSPRRQQPSQDASPARNGAVAALARADGLPSQLTPNGASLSPSAASLMSSLQRAGGLQDGHKQLLSRLLNGAKTLEEGLHCLQGASGSPLRYESASATAQDAESVQAAPYQPSGSNSKPTAQEQQLDSLVSPGYMPLPLGDVLMTPHLSADELHSMLDFLESFDTPRVQSAL